MNCYCEVKEQSSENYKELHHIVCVCVCVCARARAHVVAQSNVRTYRDKSATYLIAEYHRGRLQSIPLGKLCTDASAWSTPQNNFGTVFLEWPSEQLLYYSRCHQFHKKCLPLNISCIFGNRKKSLGVRSGE